MRILYTLLLLLLSPLLLVHIAWRGTRNPLYWRHWSDLFAICRRKTPDSVLWIHAASVGEFQAALPFIRLLRERYPQEQILISNTSPTGAARVREVFGDDVLNCLLPIDLPWLCHRFMNCYRPRIAVILETEIWPNLFYTCHRRAIPLLLANARLSEKNLVNYKRFSALFVPPINTATGAFCQSETDRQRFLKIGVAEGILHVGGNLKYDISLDDHMRQEARQLRQNLGGGRPIWLAASTREGEEQQILSTFSKILQTHPRLLLVLVPRHPERFDAVAALVKENALSLCRRSDRQECDDATQVYLLDSMGELFTHYGAADLVFVGGSLVPIGGHNILEPALWAKPITVGPYTSNLAAVIKTFKDAQAVVQVSDNNELFTEVLGLLNDPGRAQEIAANAHRLIEQNQGASRHLLDTVDEVLQRSTRV